VWHLLDHDWRRIIPLLDGNSGLQPKGDDAL
jgi:hypothetical protein